MFGSSWANPQQNQQPQQTSAFGQPSAFGATTSNAFGSTSAFGQPQQQTQQQPAQSQVNPMFGGLANPAGTTTNPGAFGAFGTPNTSNAGGAFGAKPAGGFGAFGGGTGAFGGGGTTTGAFGQPAANAAPATTSVFGQPAAPATTSAFGTTNSLFGANKAFGSTTGATGSGAIPVVTNGTASPDYHPTAEKDGNTTLQFQSISCMPQYVGYSFEELRAQDYAQGRKTASTNTGAFGQSAFGAAQPATTTNIFGAPAQQPATSIFGTTTNTTTPAPAFGQFGATNTAQPAAPATNSLFGGTGAFGQTQPQQQTGAFGGTGAFGQTQPQQQTSIFGGGGAFGNTANKASPFGTTTGTGAFGTTTTTSTPSTFGAQAQQPAQGTGLFGNTQPANTQSAFGTFGNTAAKTSIFGTTPAAQTNPSPFGTFGAANQQQQTQPQQQTQQPSLFGGGGLFGGGQQQQQQQPQQGAQPSLFGNTATTTTPSLFGNNNPNTGAGLFGNAQPQNTQQQQGQQQQQPQQQTGGLFGNIFNKPAQPATTGLFGNLGQSQAATAQQPQQNSLFGNSFNQSNNSNSLFGGNKPAAPLLGTSMSGGQNMTGSLFGGSMTGNQGSLTASINQPIAENLPIFSMLPPGPRIVDMESNAPKKKAGFFLDMPTRSPVPRVQLGYTPANSKLRGFGSMSMASSQAGNNGSLSFTSGKANALSLSKADGMSSSVGPDFLGRSGSPALGSGGRQSVKKVILEKKVEPSELFVKTGSPGALRSGKVTFSPALSVASREKDAAQASAPQPHGTPTPASRAQSSQRSATVPTPTKAQAPPVDEPKKSTELEDGDYWVRPELSVLKKAGYGQLSSFEGLVVGRKGYGEIHFLEPVDLTGLSKLGALLGDVVRFDDKECSVYPDSEEVDKPPPGSGLNVKAKLCLERCWAVDKASREPIKDADQPNAVKHLKRLKNMKDTHFESFDIKTGTWTFTVDHF